MKIVKKENIEVKYLGVKNIKTFDNSKTYKFNLYLDICNIYGCTLRFKEEKPFICFPSVKTSAGNYFNFIRFYVPDSLAEKIKNDIENGIIFSGETKNIKVNDCVIENIYIDNGRLNFNLKCKGVIFKSLSLIEVDDKDCEIVGAKKKIIVAPSKKTQKDEEIRYFPYYRLNFDNETMSELIKYLEE